MYTSWKSLHSSTIILSVLSMYMKRECGGSIELRKVFMDWLVRNYCRDKTLTVNILIKYV